jgi:hypothetical protein
MSGVEEPSDRLTGLCACHQAGEAPSDDADRRSDQRAGHGDHGTHCGAEGRAIKGAGRHPGRPDEAAYRSTDAPSPVARRPVFGNVITSMAMGACKCVHGRFILQMIQKSPGRGASRGACDAPTTGCRRHNHSCSFFKKGYDWRMFATDGRT